MDASGAAVPNAQVQLVISGGKAAVLSTTTTAEGLFAFIGVRPGTYDVNISVASFVPASVRAVKVDPIRETSLAPVKLEVATVTQSVDVVDQAATVQTANAEVSTTVSHIDRLPLLDRNVMDIALTQPGVLNASPISNGNDTVVNGLRSTYLNVTLDGINVQDNYLRENGGGFSPNRLRMSQVSEMTVATSNSSTTVGGGAAQFNMVSPSGGNQIHGQALWYNRNSAMAANDWFNNKDGVEKPFLNQNIFGGSVGGPIKKDKLFYYGAYEAARIRQTSPVNRYVLTPDARNGIYTYEDNTGAIKKVNLLGVKGVGVDPFMANILKLLPTTINNYRLGDSSQGALFNTAGYSFNQRANETQDNLTAKVDYNRSTTNAFMGAFHFVRDNVDRGDAATGFDVVPPVFNDDKVKLFTGSWRFNPSASFTNELRGGLNIAPAIFATRDKPPAMFAANASLAFDTPMNEFLPQGRKPNTYTIGDTAGYVRGRHNFQFGFNLQMVRINSYNYASTVPLYSVGMGTGQTLGLSGSDMPGAGSGDISAANNLLATLGGFVDSYTQTFNATGRTSGFVNGAPNERNWKYNNYAAFLQDQWKVAPRLTLMMGLRYDYFSPVDEANSLVLMPVVQNNNAVATLLSNATLDFAGGNSGRPLYNKDLNNFAPNIGLAWDVFGNGKTSLRAGYSINYVDDNAIATINNSAVTNSGLQQAVSAAGLSGRLSSNLPAVPTPTFKVPRTAAENYAAAPSSNAMGLIDPNLRTPYIQQWNFSIEHEMKGTTVAVRYVGNHGVKELRAVDVNQVNINAGGFLADFRRAKSNGDLARATNGVFNANYNPNIPGSQQLTVFPLLASGGLLTNSTVRTAIDQNAPGTLATTYTTNRLTNGAVQFFANPYILGGNMITNYSNSTYNALQLDVRHRYHNGLQIQGNYTWSKVLSDSMGDQQSRFEPFLDGANGKLERARAPYDLTHVFHANAYYELPFGPGHRMAASNPLLSRIAGGWSVSSVLTWQSGAPFSILSTRGTYNRSGNRSAQNTASTTLTGEQLKNVVGFYMTGDGPFFINPANINTDGRGTTQEGNKVFAGQAFTNPVAGTVGNLQRRMFDNPSVFGMDMSLQKNTRITERHLIELRFDAINVLNHATFFSGDSYNGGAPAARFVINQTSFGRIGYSFYGERLLQIGLHYKF